MATDNKIILNKTRSSTERWTFIRNSTGDELVNGKNRFKFADFPTSDHPMREQVLDWMAEKGVLREAIHGKFPANETTGPSLDHIFSTLTETEDQSVRDHLVQMHFADLNREKGKGASRRLRKQLRAMGYNRLAALKAS